MHQPCKRKISKDNSFEFIEAINKSMENSLNSVVKVIAPLIEATKDIFDEVITQQNYNVVHVLNPKSDVKILLAAHIDEVGMVINKINADGTCRLEQIGGARPYMYSGQSVVVLTEQGEVPGVIGYLPNMDKGIRATDLILDLGATSALEAKKLVRVGNPVMVNRTYTYLANDFFTGKALDDKLAVYIFLEAIKKVKGKTDLGNRFEKSFQYL